MNDDKEIGYAIVDMPHEPRELLRERRIGTIGHVDMGRSLLTSGMVAALTAEHPHVRVVSDPEEIDTIERSMERKRNPFDIPPYLIKPMPVFELEDFSPRIRQLNPSINIYSEYQLIRRKESNLSRWERNEVVRLVESW